MILPVKFSASHCNFPIICWISLSIATEVNPLEFHKLFINSIQFFEIIVVRIPLNWALAGFKRIVSHLSQTEYRVREDKDFWQWNIDKLDCAISLSTSTSNLGNWSGLCQWFLSDPWPAFLFPWKAVPQFSKDNYFKISNSCHSLFRDEPLLEEWYP